MIIIYNEWSLLLFFFLQTGLIASTDLGCKLMNNLKRPGVIVNISAIYAIKSQPQLPIFSATKAAVLAATLGFSVNIYDT